MDKKILVLVLILTLSIIIPMAKAETITLYHEDSYDFSEKTRGTHTGGDFYYLSYNNASAFWANNLGQRGLQDLGNIGDLPLVEVIIPYSGYTRFGVLALVNHTYVSLAGEGEEGSHIVFRVLSVDADNSSVTIDYYYSEGAPPAMWTQTYGGTEWESGQSVVVTSDGGYAIAGYTYSFGAGSADVWLVKTDDSGVVQWNQTYGGILADQGYSMVQTSDGGYAIVGSTRSFGAGDADVWLVKTDATGNEQWNQTCGGIDGDYGFSVVETNDSGYAIVGSTRSFGAGDGDAWLVKTDASGVVQWNQTYGGTNWDDGSSVVMTGDGGYAIVGTTYSYGAGGPNIWLVKTDAVGTLQWNQTYGGTEFDVGSSVVMTGDGGYALAGRTRSFGAGNLDVWLVKTDANGNEQWNQTYGGLYDEYESAVVETSDGGYAIAGYTNSFGAGIWDCWLVKTDASGVMQWHQTYGGIDWDMSTSVVETSDGGYAIAGETLSFGSGGDVWLVKTDEYGIVPDFAGWLFLPLLVIATLSIYISKKKLLHKQQGKRR